ncbi:ParB/RepB/Spo0J family partition protein [Streptomyces cinereoruber]|uniref:ParB/RepB/Spo0J family partition protein n=1 Tax=Streptomyces cinereoruber TaxID=67260 RepID=UPI003627C322
MSKKDAVPRYTPAATPGPSRNDILAQYDLAPGGADDREAEMRQWEEAQARRLSMDAAQTGLRVPLSELSPNPDNPRTSDDTDRDGLRESVAELGVIQALTVSTRDAFVRHHPQHAGTPLARYVVIAGHRRLSAAQAAGHEDAPVIVEDRAAENPLVWAVAENVQRVGLNPMEQARALRVLTDPPPAGRGMGQAAVARGIGKSQGFVSQRISLLRLVTDLQEQVLDGTMKVKRGLLVARLPAEEQTAAAAALRQLPPDIQADIDGGRLTDIEEALRLSASPPHKESRSTKPAPRTPRQRSAQARQLRISDPEQMAADLAQALSREDLNRLALLLTEHCAEPITE